MGEGGEEGTGRYVRRMAAGRQQPKCQGASSLPHCLVQGQAQDERVTVCGGGCRTPYWDRHLG